MSDFVDAFSGLQGVADFSRTKFGLDAPHCRFLLWQTLLTKRNMGKASLREYQTQL
jgi:hypothetical protein